MRADEGIVMRIHRVRSEVVVAACDAELLGQELHVGSTGHRVRVASQFYGERAVSRRELLDALRLATIANLLGPRTVGVAEAEGFVDKGQAGSLGGVPHAEIFTVFG